MEILRKSESLRKSEVLRNSVIYHKSEILRKAHYKAHEGLTRPAKGLIRLLREALKSLIRHLRAL